jgi:chemotaxis protein histidine kinase CheA
MAPRELAELDSYYAGINEGTKDSVASYRIKVHSMKNSAALVGALGLSAKALELEQAADREDTEAIKIGHDAFCREYKDMADRIREAVLGEVGSDARTMDDGTLSDNLDVLEKAMSDLDMTTINEKVFEMSDFGYSSPDIEKFMEELFTAIRDYDTDRFDSLIQEIRTHL